MEDPFAGYELSTGFVRVFGKTAASVFSERFSPLDGLGHDFYRSNCYSGSTKWFPLRPSQKKR